MYKQEWVNQHAAKTRGEAGATHRAAKSRPGSPRALGVTPASCC